MPKSLFIAKHHKFIAEAIKASRKPPNNLVIEAYILLAILCFSLKQDNPKFDPESFRYDCGEQPVHSD